MTAEVVVLTNSGQYWGETTIGKVVKWLLNGKAAVLAEDEKERVRCSLDIKRPFVVQLLTGFTGYTAKSKEVKFSKEAVFKRDKNVCQFWHYDRKGHKIKHKCKPDERTLEHLTPKSRGGKNSFTNCVCSCAKCNIHVKKDRTPEEAGLELIRKPFVPAGHEERWVTINFTYDPNKLSHRVYRDILRSLSE